MKLLQLKRNKTKQNKIGYGVYNTEQKKQKKTFSKASNQQRIFKLRN